MDELNLSVQRREGTSVTEAMGTAYKEFALYPQSNKKSLMGLKLGKGAIRPQFQKAYFGSCVERMDSRETKWMQDPGVTYSRSWE